MGWWMVHVMRRVLQGLQDTAGILYQTKDVCMYMYRVKNNAHEDLVISRTSHGISQIELVGSKRFCVLIKAR